jgi:peptidoglycan/LPS O-acetylase OafA/YrhL
MSTTGSAQAIVHRAVHLKRLTALRAFAALLVFGNHLALRGGDVGVGRYLFEYGYTGVGFFFVLSGFVLAWSTAPGASKAAFYVRRFARIYPSHLAMLIVAVLVPVTIVPVTWGAFLPNALLVQSWSFGKYNPYTFNGVSWSLSCEVAFYAVLPFLLLLPRRLGARALWLLAFSYWALASIVTVVLAVHHLRLDGAYVFPPLRGGEFLLGVVAAIRIKDGWRLPIPVAVVIAGVGLALMAASWNRFPAGDVGAALFFLIVVVLGAQRDIEHPNGWLAHPWLVYAGQVSFAFYLVHELIIINLVPLGIRGWALDPIALVVSAVAAVALHHLVERPFERRLRSLRLPGRGERVAEAPRPLSG